MPFHAKVFIYDGIPSEQYDLYLGDVGGSGESTTSGSNDVGLLTQKLFRRPVPLYFGAEQTPVLSFPLSIYSPNEITADSYSTISGWLFGSQNYHELRICQDDMYETYFNALLTAPQVMRIGNVIQTITSTVICDSPWGYREPKTFTENYGDGYSIHDTINFYNESANSFYTYPTELVITANIFGGSITITNASDMNRQFVLTLLPLEVLTLNCDLQFISSSLVTYPLSKFNKMWLRFVRGLNVLSVVGNISNISITSPIAVKVG